MSLSSPPSACPRCKHPIRRGTTSLCCRGSFLRGQVPGLQRADLRALPARRAGDRAGLRWGRLWSERSSTWGFWLLPAYLYFAAVTDCARPDRPGHTDAAESRLWCPPSSCRRSARRRECGDRRLVFLALGGRRRWRRCLPSTCILVLIYPSGMGFGDVKLAASSALCSGTSDGVL